LAQDPFRHPSVRWALLVTSFLIMAIISIYQYSWFLFAYALQKQYSWSLSAVGMAFTIFNIATFSQPFSGYVADAYGPRSVAVAGALLVGMGYMASAYATSPLLLYVYYGLGGLGVGFLYGIATACAVKWFPDRRGFATGLVVFGYGAGTALFNPFIEILIETRGIQTTYLYLGAAMLLSLLPLSLFFQYPHGPAVAAAGAGKQQSGTGGDYKPFEMLRTHQWYLIYFSFISTISIVLIFGAQMKMVAKEFAIPSNYFAVLLVLFPLGNGLSRVISGSISDRLGREKTMVLFYSLLGASIFLFVLVAHVPVLFVLIVCIVALLGGSPFALYPATIGDYYGPSYSTTNYGITYTAKAFAGVIAGWFCGYAAMQFGSFKFPLILVAIGSLLAAVLSMPSLMKPPQRKQPA
jgi:OFA family oxalate/formate antiporter-like MFS transporter